MSVRVVLVADSCLRVAWHDDRGDEGAGVPGEAAVWCEVLDGLRRGEVCGLRRSDVHLLPDSSVVLRAYHDGEGDSLDPQGFRDLFAADGVLNGIGGVEGQRSLRGTQLSGLIAFLAQFLPDIHRELKQITVSGDVVSIELSIQGTLLGPFQTPSA